MRNISLTTNRFLAIGCFLTSFLNVKSQNNLVPNYSFEDYLFCPVFSNSYYPDPWQLTGRKATGYTNSCSTDWRVGVPVNTFGGEACFQYARTGNAYIATDYLNGPSRFYPQVKLNDSLHANTKYYCEYFVNIPNSLMYAVNNIGMLITDTAPYSDINKVTANPIIAAAQIINYSNPIIGDTVNWTKVSGIYTAHGGEQYITLGNFATNANTKVKIINPAGFAKSSYYIDDVSVIPLDSMLLQADAGRDTTIKIGDSVFIGSYTNGIDTLKWYNQNTGMAIDSVQPGFWIKPTVNTCYIITQTVNGFTSSDTVCITVKPLPLQFISFSISPSFGGVRGGWTTANEVNVSHHNILRSINAKDFEKIGTVKALNNSYNEYSFIDELKPNTQYPTPLYYRIESIDKDGRKQYSAIKTVTINHSSLNVTIYPNPAKDVVNIYCKEGIKEVKLINTLGQIVRQQMFSNPVNSLPWRVGETKGLYIVQVETKNGNVVNEKIIVQ